MHKADVYSVVMFRIAAPTSDMHETTQKAVSMLWLETRHCKISNFYFLSNTFLFIN